VKLDEIIVEQKDCNKYCNKYPYKRHPNAMQIEEKFYYESIEEFLRETASK